MSVAENFRATTRARSSKEYFSKLCIVVEECDETLFWLELLGENELIDNEKIES
jgi:four helix bundle protein